jgi:hypothetical protein
VHTDRPAARPWVEFRSDLAPQAVRERFQALLATPDCPVEGQVVAGHIELFVRTAERHFWSPWLSLEVRELEDSTRIRGRFGPHPHVWTAFMAIYAVLAFAGIIAAMYGWAQRIVGDAGLALLGVPAAAALAAFVYGAEWIGKGLGAEQMILLRDVVRDALEAPEG